MSRLSTRTVGILIALLLGSVQAWQTRMDIYPDGISYLDLADAWLRGDWEAAVNGHWSPLYPWMIAAASALLQPDAASDPILLHGVNFLAYLMALAAFDRMLGEVEALAAVSTAESDAGLMPAMGAVRALAYPLFAWASLVLISLGLTTPDLLLTAILYLAVAMVLRIQRGESSVTRFAALGFVMGVGYLAKSIMFPLAAFVAISAVAAHGWRRGFVFRGAVFVIGFSLVAGPYVTTLSSRLQRFSYSEAATHNYAWLINGVEYYAHWQGGPPGAGTPLHPTRILHVDPTVYEFAHPVAGTYPPWYDPTYWYDGVTPHFDFERQLANTLAEVRDCARWAFYDQSFAVGGLVVAWLFGVGALLSTVPSGSNVLLRRLLNQHPLLLPAVAGCAMYAALLFVPRYVAAYLTLIGVAMIAAVPLPPDARPHMSRLCQCVAGVLWCIVAVEFGMPQGGVEDATPEVAVAHDLRSQGLAEGTPMAFVGNSFRAYWARFGRFRIVSEIRPDEAEAYRAADDQTLERVHDAFRKSGAVAVVAQRTPPRQEGWRRIGQSNYFVLRLDSNS
jgi:hypothetical protein